MSEPITNVKVKLVGKDGNAFAIMGIVRKAMREANVPQKTISEYMNEAISGNYDQLLQTTMKYVEVE